MAFRRSFLLVLGVFWFFSTGASIIDKETKEGVLGLDQKVQQLDSKISQLEQKLGNIPQQIEQQLSRNDQAMKAIREEIKNIQVYVPEQQAIDPSALDPKFQGIEQHILGLEQKLQEMDRKMGQVAQQGKVHYADFLQSLGYLRQDMAGLTLRNHAGVSPPPAPVTQIPSEVRKSLTRAEDFQRSSTVLFAISLLVSLATLIVVQKRLGSHYSSPSKKTTRHPDETSRPHLKTVATDGHVLLVNEGTNAADHIRLFMGPTPTTMKHKLRTITSLKAGDMSEIHLPRELLVHETVFAHAEYRNRETGRLYKEQLTLQLPPSMQTQTTMVEKTATPHPLQLRTSI